MVIKARYIWIGSLVLITILLLVNRSINPLGMAGLTTFSLAYLTKGMRRS